VTDAAPPDGDEERHQLLEKLTDARERHLRRPRPVRWLIAAVGFTLFLGGVAMLVLPGPAFAVIPIGLFLLALEFQWAEEWLERSVNEAEKAKRRAAETSRTQRILGGVSAALAVGGLAAWAYWGDIPLLPV
jgi:tellurite resistance protein TerC